MNIERSVEKKLIEKYIIIENNLMYKFAHDKFEDITDKKLLDRLYIDKDIVELTKGIKNELSYGRAFKLWVKDRLSNGELLNVSQEIDRLYDHKEISYLWKWNIIESVFDSKYFYEYLNIKKEDIKSNSEFVKKLYEISTSCNLVDLNQDMSKVDSLRRYFNYFVVPSFKAFSILNYFNNNRECINTENVIYIVKVIEETIKIKTIFGYEIAKFCIYLMDLIMYLIESFSQRIGNGELSKSLKICFFNYAPIFKETAHKYLSDINKDEKSDFEDQVAESIIMKSKDINNLVIIPNDFIKEFYFEILNIFKNKSLYKEDGRHHFYHEPSDEELFGLNDDYSHFEAYTNKTIIYELFGVDFDKTLESVIEFINGRVKEYYTNRNKLKYKSIDTMEFIFQGEKRLIYYGSDHYSAYRSNTSISPFLVSILMALERALIEKSESEDISSYLTEILTKSNNIMLIAVAMSIIIFDYQKYGDLFIEMARNYYIRDFEISRLVQDSSHFNFPTRDFLAQEDRKKFKDLPHRKYHYDKVFQFLQQTEEFQEKAFSVLDLIKKDFADKGVEIPVIIKNYLHNIDIRNYEFKEKIDDKLVYGPKQIDDIEVQKAINQNENELSLSNEFNKYYFFLVFNKDIGNINADEVFTFINDYSSGKYKGCNYLSTEHIDQYIQLFLLRNHDRINKKQYQKLLSDFTKIINELSKQHSYNNILFINQVIGTIPMLNKKYILKNKELIIRFLFNQILVESTNFNAKSEIYSALYKVYDKFENIYNRVFLLLIQYLNFDDANLDIHNRPYKSHKMILITEINQAKSYFRKKLLSRFRKSDEISGKININPENLDVLYSIIQLTNVKNKMITEKYLFSILKLIIDNSKENWIDKAKIECNSAISEFIIKCIKNSWDVNSLIGYIIYNVEVFYEILIHAIDHMSAHVQDGDINADIGWGFIKKILEKIYTLNYKNKLYCTVKDHFVKNINHYNIGRLLETALLLNLYWINRMEPEHLQILDGNENEYVSTLVKFIDTGIGMGAIAKIAYKYEKQLGENVIFEFSDEIMKNTGTPNIFSEPNSIYYYEQLFERIFLRYSKLTTDNRNKFYELLTNIGCNAPSSFLLYLKRKLEY